MADFGDFEQQTAGTESFQVALWNGSENEDTEIFVHVPESYAPGAKAPLLMMAHGTGGSGRAQDSRWQHTAEELGMIVVCPSESADNSGYRFSERERETALSAIRWARRRFNIDENRIYLSGISRGGHMCWDLALRYPDLPAAIAPMIGGPRLALQQGQNNLRYLENISRLPIRDLQGSEDDPLLLLNLQLAFDELEAFGSDQAQLIEFPQLAHHFDFSTVDWIEFLGQSRRDPRPKHVIRVAARKGEGRAFWFEALSYRREVREDFRIKVTADEWNRLDEAGQRKLMHRRALERSARAEASQTAPGRFQISSKGLRKFRLLLDANMLDAEGRIEVLVDGKILRRRPKPSKRVLLREFAERFDRSFLPSMEFRN
ncbi:MAG: carboxylesterase family protein [Planctomycetota bacterium]|jgi:predicted esterase